MTPTLNDQLSAIEARAGKATAGPWKADDMSHRFVWPVHQPKGIEIIKIYTGNDADQPFIAHSRTDIPALCRLARAQEEALQRCREALETMLESASPHPVEHPSMAKAWKKGRAALAAAELDAAGILKGDKL